MFETKDFLNEINFSLHQQDWINAKPFSHILIDNFLKKEVIEAVVSEFPEFNDGSWKTYNNPIEIKKLLNHWDKFGPTTYRLFQYLNSQKFILELEKLTECKLYPDYGLNGGGLHSHKSGGKLNAHLDYSIHPKLKMERRVNLLIYVTPDWNDEWGGMLGLWSKDPEKFAPGELIKQIAPQFNRAILFDTTQDSWHGLPEAIKCPNGITRNSLAVYYLCEPRIDAEQRGKALFAPHGDQASDPEILKLIQARSQVSSAADVYGDDKKI